MPQGLYIGVEGLARKVKNMYVGVDGVARKVTKGYVGVDGIARQFWSLGNDYTLAYTGLYEDTEITAGGVQYRLLTLISSGELNVTGNVTGDICLVGAGAHGVNNMDGLYGGCGGYLHNFYGIRIIGTPVQIGAPEYGISSNIDTVLGDNVAKGAEYRSRVGGTGGGGGGNIYTLTYDSKEDGGKGDGLPKIPFGDSVNFTRAHCAGGGGGGGIAPRGNLKGGIGGQNGGDGGNSIFPNSYAYFGSGGIYGGGDGGYVYNGSYYVLNGKNAYGYGSGGGGSGCIYSGSSLQVGTPGKGFQGVAYIRIAI